MPSGQPPSSRRVPGLDLRPLRSLDEGTWAEGIHASTGTAVLVRFVDGVPFADAFEAIGDLLAVIEAPPADVLPPKGVAVLTRGGEVAAAAFATDAGFEIPHDAAASAGVGPDDPVDVVVLWGGGGEAMLADVQADPVAACGRLAGAAAILDRLALMATPGGGRGHGALDGPCLRVIDGAARIVGTAMSRLAAARRGRLDAVGPWQVVPAECCLPPGEPGARSDQYALAALWAHARTARPPYPTGDAAEIVRSKLTSVPTLDGLQEGERAIVARALSPAPDHRFASCAEFAAALARVVEPTPAVDAPKPPPAEPPVAANPEPPSRTEAIPRRIPAETPRVLPAHEDDPAPISAAVVDTGSDDVEETKRSPVPNPAPVRPEPARVTSRGGATSPPVPPTPAAAAFEAGPAAVSGMAVTATAAPATAAPGTGSYGGPLAGYPYKEGDVIVPGYRLVKTLGKGGFGEVWRASAPGGMSVAIKVIPHLGREGAKEFRAIQTVKDIHHAHIVPMVGVWLKGPQGKLLDENETRRVEEVLCKAPRDSSLVTVDLGSVPAPDQLELVIAMGLGDQTLAQRLEQRKALLGDGYDGVAGIEPTQLLVWMRQAAMAIDHFNRGAGRGGASSADVQHCDIKPHNIMLVGNAVQVCDFGLARVQGEVRATVNNHLSVAYAAPEMTSKPHRPSPTTDQYSLAVTYHELRTGLLPYAGQTGRNPDELSAFAILEAKRGGDLDLSQVGPAERRVLERALAVVPHERFGSCEEMVDALTFAVEGDADALPARTKGRVATSAGAPRKSLLGLAGLAAGGALVAGLVCVLLFATGAGGAKRRMESARTALEEAVGDGDRLQDGALDEAERLLEPIDGGTYPEAESLRVAIEAARGIDALDDRAGLDAVGEARERFDAARAALPEAVGSVLERRLATLQAAGLAAQAERTAAADVAALDSAGRPSPAEIEEVERRIGVEGALDASARHRFQTRLAKIRERHAETVLAEAHEALESAVTDGSAPLDRTALERAGALASQAASYRAADADAIDGFRRALDALSTLFAALGEPQGAPAERATALHDAVDGVFSLDGAVPADLQRRLEPRVAATLRAIHLDAVEEARKHQDTLDPLVIDRLVAVNEAVMVTTGGSELDSEVLNTCAGRLVTGEGIDEDTGKRAEALVRLGLGNLDSRGTGDEQSAKLSMLMRHTLVEALVKEGRADAAVAEWERALADVETLAVPPPIKRALRRLFEDLESKHPGTFENKNQ